MQPPLCRHVKTNGMQCRAIALNGQHFCYFHRRIHDGHQLYRTQLFARPSKREDGWFIELPELEDRESVQIAISKVVHALGCQLIDPKQASIILYGLQIAASNLRGLGDMIAHPTEVVRDVESIPGYSNHGIDLAAEPPQPEPQPATEAEPEPAPALTPEPIAAPPEPLPEPASPKPLYPEPLPANVIAISASAAPSSPSQFEFSPQQRYAHKSEFVPSFCSEAVKVPGRDVAEEMSGREPTFCCSQHDFSGQAWLPPSEHASSKPAQNQSKS